jgi:hypothetical protein
MGLCNGSQIACSRPGGFLSTSRTGGAQLLLRALTTEATCDDTELLADRSNPDLVSLATPTPDHPVQSPRGSGGIGLQDCLEAHLESRSLTAGRT